MRSVRGYYRNRGLKKEEKSPDFDCYFYEVASPRGVASFFSSFNKNPELEARKKKKQPLWGTQEAPAFIRNKKASLSFFIFNLF